MNIPAVEPAPPVEPSLTDSLADEEPRRRSWRRPGRGPGRRRALRVAVLTATAAVAAVAVGWVGVEPAAAAGHVPSSAGVRAAAHGVGTLAVNSLPTIVANIRTWIMGLLAGLATLFLTIGGVRYLMAGGDPGEVERAKASFRSAAIGYSLAVIAPVVLTILKSIIGG